MADEILIFDAAASNPDGSNPGSPLSVGPGTNYPLIEASFPAPPLSVAYSSSIDAEGESPVSRRHGNRTITLRFEMLESGANDTLLDALQAKFAKLQREGGTLKRTRKDGSTIRIYDIVAGDGWEPSYDFAYLLANLSSVPVQLTAKPYARSAEADLGDNTETSLPALIFSETGVAGDWDGLGRLLIDNDAAAGNDWWALRYGLEQDTDYTFTTSSGSGALFYEAESRTALGGSATAVGPSGASGAGSNVMRNTALTTSYQAIMSMQASGGGAYPSHVGTFQILARVQIPTTNSGTTSVALEWGEGDFRRFTRNTARSLDSMWEGKWARVDLGQVTITKAPQGTHRWDGRIIASSTAAGDDIDIDWIMLIPVTRSSGEVSAVARIPTATSFVARDEFDQSAGALAGKTPPVSTGNWAAAGDTDDFAVETTGKTAQRTATSDTGGAGTLAGAWALCGTGTHSAVAVTLDFKRSATSFTQGIVARYTALTDQVVLVVDSLFFALVKWVGGTQTTIGLYTHGGSLTALDAWYTMTLVIDAGGNFYGWAGRQGDIPSTPQIVGHDSVLATGGTLASGRVGMVDGAAATAGTRNYDNFAAWVPTTDAAVYGGQSLEIRHDRVIREDSAGAIWQRPSDFTGFYCRVPPAGAEARTTRVIITPLYHAPAAEGVWVDDRTDDLSAKLFATGRYLT